MNPSPERSTRRARSRRDGDPPARATITDVAARAGVSVAAVSKVMNGRGGISAATAQRIHEAAAQLHWSPSAAAVALRGARSRTVALVLRRNPDLLDVDPHFGSLISGIESVLAPRGFGLQLHLVGETTQAEAAMYRRLVQQRRVDGAVLTESRVDDPRFALLSELGLPAVLIGAPDGGAPFPHVEAAHQERGITQAAEHLLELGHRRIAYVSGPGDRLHTSQRLGALTSCLARAGVPAPHVLVTGFSGDDAAASTLHLLSGVAPERRPTAVVYANDTMAIAGMNTAARMGVCTPRDLSVVGYDDLPLGRWVHPRLTTVSQDPPGLGAAAATALLLALGETDLQPVEVRPPELIVRDSTGPVGR